MEERGGAVAFVNRVNALALRMTRLPQFRERRRRCLECSLLLEVAGRGEGIRGDVCLILFISACVRHSADYSIFFPLCSTFTPQLAAL